jgi:transcriptional regulator with XRE-family HTH domain
MSLLHKGATNMTNEDIGKRIKEIRLQRGFTKSKICNKLGKSTGWLRRRENGKTLFSVYDIIIIANILEEPVNKIFA